MGAIDLDILSGTPAIRDARVPVAA